MSNNQNSKREYSIYSTHSKPCYSNVEMYGCGGNQENIYEPVPITIFPKIFLNMKPDMSWTYSSQNFKNTDCYPYKSMNDLNK